MRQPCLGALSPPIWVKGAMLAALRKPSASAIRISPPQMVPSSPKPVPSKDTPITGPVLSFSAMQDRMWA